MREADYWTDEDVSSVEFLSRERDVVGFYAGCCDVGVAGILEARKDVGVG